MGLKRVTRAALAFAVCLLGVPAASAQSLDSQGRLSRPIDNRISTQQGTVYGREKAKREADRQADFHSRYQPNRSEAWTPKSNTSPSYKPTTTGSKAADIPSPSTAYPLGGAGMKKPDKSTLDYARSKAMMRNFDKPGGDATSVIGKQAPFSGATTPGYVGTVPSRVTPDASKSTSDGKKEGDAPSLYGEERDANDPAEVPELLKHVRTKKSSASGDKEDADAQK